MGVGTIREESGGCYPARRLGIFSNTSRTRLTTRIKLRFARKLRRELARSGVTGDVCFTQLSMHSRTNSGIYKLRGSIRNNQLFHGKNEKVFRAANARTYQEDPHLGRTAKKALSARWPRKFRIAFSRVTPTCIPTGHTTRNVPPRQAQTLQNRHEGDKTFILAPPKDTKTRQTTSPQQRHKRRQTQAIKKTQEATDTKKTQQRHKEATHTLKGDRHKTPTNPRTRKSDRHKPRNNDTKSDNKKVAVTTKITKAESQKTLSDLPPCVLCQKSHTPYTPLESRTYKNRPKMGQTSSWRLSSLHIITTLVTPVLPRKEVEATPP